MQDSTNIDLQQGFIEGIIGALNGSHPAKDVCLYLIRRLLYRIPSHRLNLELFMQ
jgi:hypothetical protein